MAIGSVMAITSVGYVLYVTLKQINTSRLSIIVFRAISRGEGRGGGLKVLNHPLVKAINY